ncbi:MAG: VOC family protein [Rhizomicrobium sp.]|jgi:catechol 2,3-dioxygenase-like lactoylglutathione lyase family enzyme
MPSRGAIHHLDLTVCDPVSSRHFYETVLGFMGYRTGHADGRGIDFDLDLPGGAQSIGIVRAERAENGHDRYSPGLHHVAFVAASRDDVDRFHSLLVGMGATVLDPPAEYPAYGPGYYAIFFADPDGLKLEYVFEPTGRA